MTDKTLQDRLRDPAHGFDRNDSHTEDRYVCLCEHLANEAADALDAQAERIKALEGLTAVMHKALSDGYHSGFCKGPCDICDGYKAALSSAPTRTIVR